MRSIGWALFGVNFKPLQEIEIMGGGWIFDTGPFFARETTVYELYATLCLNF